MIANINMNCWVGSKGTIKTVGQNNAKVVTISVSTKALKGNGSIWFDCEFWGEGLVKLTEKYSKGDLLCINGVFASQEFYLKKSGENWGSNKVYVKNCYKISGSTKRNTTQGDLE